MLTRTWDNIWFRQLAVVAGYAVSYLLLREISFSHWVLFAGLRLCVLMLMPYRYWPALLLGELLPLSYISLSCLDQYGRMWSAVMLVPPIGLAMPIVHFCREQRRLFPARTITSINVLLLCSLLVSVVWTAADTTALILATLQTPYDYRAAAGRYFLGSYIGILTVVPLVLSVREELAGKSLRQAMAGVSESRLVLETVSLLLPALALLVWLASGVAGDASQAARMAMFLPVAWLSLRHGWRGAAVGGTAASIAVILTMPVVRDHETVQAEVFIAFTITTMLMLGARIAVLHQRERQERMDSRLALAMAQRNVYLGELQLRQTSYALEQMSGAIQASYTQLLGRLRCLLPGTDERTYYRQAAVAQHQMYRLADSLYPLSWRDRGLPAALREGSIPRALDEGGIVYWCDIQGDVEQLSTSVHMALYRLASEAIALSCAKRNISKLRVRLRSGRSGGRRWAVLCVDSDVDYERLARVRWDDVHAALGGSGMGLGALKDRAGIFEGTVHARAHGTGSRISLILFDPDIA
ncbi:MAG TPA: MASE1 domain-containing protein [Frateuria sp.]|uniref:MASE1 domain-containing protein n=1 Tax=Frateuria sp. TaxID=2211372 RepID=UPI002D7E9B71|nr:MASE1 domain-containing protein [Frateuria sp.]HET6806859.1 MASE1 domain-containing protein [Frateuria sp.]